MIQRPAPQKRQPRRHSLREEEKVQDEFPLPGVRLCDAVFAVVGIVALTEGGPCQRHQKHVTRPSPGAAGGTAGGDALTPAGYGRLVPHWRLTVRQNFAMPRMGGRGRCVFGAGGDETPPAPSLGSQPGCDDKGKAEGRLYFWSAWPFIGPGQVSSYAALLQRGSYCA